MQDWYAAVVDVDMSTYNGLYIEKIDDSTSAWDGKYIPKGDDLTDEDKIALNRLLLKTNLFFGVSGPMVTGSTSSPVAFPNLQHESVALLAFTLALTFALPSSSPRPTGTLTATVGHRRGVERPDLLGNAPNVRQDGPEPSPLAQLQPRQPHVEQPRKRS